MPPHVKEDKKTEKYPAEKEVKKDRPGVDPKNPTNADYDYRADHGQTGGGAEHNPEVDDQVGEKK